MPRSCVVVSALFFTAEELASACRAAEPPLGPQAARTTVSAVAAPTARTPPIVLFRLLDFRVYPHITFPPTVHPLIRHRGCQERLPPASRRFRSCTAIRAPDRSSRMFAVARQPHRDRPV